MAERPTFDQVYALLCGKGPGVAISSRGTHYRLEGRDGKILAFPKSGRVTIHADFWGEDRTCQATRAGGIYNGPYSIYDWYLSFRSAVEMKTYTAVVEQCPDTGLYVGYVPGFPGAHTQGKTLDELNKNFLEVIGMLLEDGEPELEALYIGTQTVTVG
jgi:predicted RNase H-like HicB family nuclease